MFWLQNNMEKTFLQLFLISSGICGILGSSSQPSSITTPGLEENKTTHIILQQCVPLHELSNVYKLQIHGTNISFKDIRGKKRCAGRIGYLELFALNEIVINRNMDREGPTQVVLIAPKIKVLGEKYINLSGANGRILKQFEAVDAEVGLDGNDGLSGLPGSPGGIFIAITNEIENAESLQITANGGDGGKAQTGGLGGNGAQGASPNVQFVEINEPLISYKGCTNRITKCIVRGQDGMNGSKGGNGGRSGKGGKAGRIFVYQLNSNHSEIKKQVAVDGQLGMEGMGGVGGEGGRHGGYVEVYCCDNSTKMFRENISSIKRMGGLGEPGDTGIDGASVHPANNPEEFQPFREFSLIVNDYKAYLSSHMNDDSTNDVRVQFYNQLTMNEEINKQNT